MRSYARTKLSYYQFTITKVFDLFKEEITKATSKPTSEDAVSIKHVSLDAEVAALCKRIMAISEKRKNLMKSQTAGGNDSA